ITTYLPRSIKGADQPAAALVKDLQRRGLLDTTLVHWGGEMGRLPVIQYRGPDKKPGRDHNTDGFSMWLAGGGVKGGYAHGTTDGPGGGIPLAMIRRELTVAVVCDALDAVGLTNQSPRVPLSPLTSDRRLVGRCRTTLWADMFHADPRPYELELRAVDACRPD